MEPLQVITKHSTEAYAKVITYADRLPTGALPSSVAVTAIDLGDGTSAASILGSSSVDDETSVVTIQAGTDGHAYLVTVRTTLDNGSIFTDQLEVRIRDVR